MAIGYAVAQPAPEAQDESAKPGGKGVELDDGGVVSRPRFERFEVVADSASIAEGDRPGNGWGGHQTRVLRMGNGDVYTAYLTAGASFDAAEWHVVRRSEGRWHEVTSGPAGREPVNILRTADSEVAVIAWPNAAPMLTTLRLVDGAMVREDSRIPGQWEPYAWPYNAAGIGADGTLCALQSLRAQAPGSFSWACRNGRSGDWQFRQAPLPYRYCYAYVFPASPRLTLVAVRDVTWETLGQARPAGGHAFAFNEVRAYFTSDQRTGSLASTVVREEPPTERYREPTAHHIEAYVDRRGRLHVLYTLGGQSTGGSRQTRHALLVGGKVVADVKLPAEGFWRLTQDSTGRFWALYGTGSRFAVYPALSEDGLALGAPTELDLGAEQVRYAGMAIAVPRAGVPLDDVVDGVFPSGRLGERWVYFRLRLR